MIVNVDTSPVGSGKTYRLVEKAVSHPSRWLVAVERLEAIDELHSRIISSTLTHGTKPVVERIKSNNARGYSVRQEVEALHSKYDRAAHVIALCTHEAMKMSDLGEFKGWHLVIDEVPSAMNTENIGSQLDLPFFENHFTLEHVHGSWSKVGLTEAGQEIDGSMLHQDDSHRHLRLFHRHVKDTLRSEDKHVVCNLREWSAMTQPNLKWTWWDYFSLRELGAFASVQLLGNGFLKSFTAKLWKQWEPEVKWVHTSTAGDRKLENRRVTVVHFSNDRRASKNFFASEKGERALIKIARYLAADTTPDKLIWSGNAECVGPLSQHLDPRGHLTPKQSGADCWMDRTHAAMMYAAKPNPSMRGVLDCMAMEQDAWVESNEFEVVLQFVTRISVRDVSSREHAFAYVFDRNQANYLMSFFEDQPHIEADLQYVDLGLDLDPEKSGPKPRGLTPLEIEDAKIERKRNKALYEKQRRARRKAA